MIFNFLKHTLKQKAIIMFKKTLTVILLTAGCVGLSWAQNRQKAAEDKDLGMEILPNKIQDIADTTKKDSLKQVPQFQSARVVAPPTTQPVFEEPEAIAAMPTPVAPQPTVQNAPPPVSEPILEAQPISEVVNIAPETILTPEMPAEPPVETAPEPVMSMSAPTLDPNPTVVAETEMTAKGGTVEQETAQKEVKFAELTFDNKDDEATIDFGRIKLGERPQRLFKFKNTGNEDLEIELVSACDCTLVEYSKSKIPPAGEGYVQMTFDSYKVVPEGVNRLSEKEITIILKNIDPKNGYQIIKLLNFKVFVEGQ